jgi:chromosome partitioning protein
MATIVFASSKGGAGKTTAATVLVSELARQGKKQNIEVSLIDADPNQHSALWAKLEGCPDNLRLYENISESNLLDAIEDAEEKSGFVIIDLEGTASMAVGMAISRADLVIVPCQGSDKDAVEAIKTIKNIKQQSRAIGREIKFAILMTRTSPAIVTRGYKAIVKQFEEAKIPLFNSQLIDREAFKAIGSFGGIVNDLPPKGVSGIDKAAKNAFAYAKEVIEILQCETHKLEVVGG